GTRNIRYPMKSGFFSCVIPGLLMAQLCAFQSPANSSEAKSSTARESDQAAKWKVLENCRLIDNPENDGDTFHTGQMGKEYIFRLYFVDAPEIDLSFPDRAWEQAAYFEMDRDKVLDLGQKAKAFAGDFVGKGYTVVTSWQKAKGVGAHDRF